MTDSARCTRCRRPAELFLCWTCSKALRRTLNEIPWLATEVANAAHGETKLDERQFFEHHPLSEDEEQSPVPFNLRASMFADELRAVLARWIRDLCESRGVDFEVLGCSRVPIGPLPIDAPRRIRADYVPTTGELAQWLAHHFVSIAASEDAELCASEIHEAYERGIEIINRRDQGVYCGPCPTIVGTAPDGKTPIRCKEALYAKRGPDGKPTSFVTCGRCRTRHDVEKLRDRIFAQADNFLLTATELFRVLDELDEHLPRNRFYGWRKSGEIHPRGWKSADGRISQIETAGAHPVFALAEVRTLAAQVVSCSA